MLATSAGARVRLVRVRHAAGVRILAVLDAPTRESYVRLVSAIASRVEATLSSAVLANRIASSSVEPPALRLRPWRFERRMFAARLAELAGRSGTLTFADVRRCYGSISPTIVADGLGRIGIDSAGEIERFLARLELDGVRGLPVGPDPSAVLANAVLAHVDRRLGAAGIEHLRWVDDVVLAGDDPKGALAELRCALADIGLRLNEHKTRVVADPSRPGVDTTVSGRRGAV